MSEDRALNTGEGVRVVTSNSFITGVYAGQAVDGKMEPIYLDKHSRKILYIAISQCKKDDKAFYEYGMTIKEFANMTGVDSSNIYRVADDVCARLACTAIKAVVEGRNKAAYYSLFSKCEYDEKRIKFKINTDMIDFFLNLSKNFSQPLLDDFMRMNSAYSMAVWHLMQREMKSKKPYADHVIEFYLTLDELRTVTGTQDKLKQLIHFKERVLDVAVKDIRESTDIVIEYENVRKGRSVVGFNFKATAGAYYRVKNGAKEDQSKAKKSADHAKEVRAKAKEKGLEVK